MAKELYPHQARALEMLRNSIRSGKRRPILQAPCAFGKTLLASKMLTGAIEKNNKAMFIVPFLSLVDQSFAKFVDEGIDPELIGVLQGDHPWKRPDAPIQVASLQTLRARDLKLDDFLIVDECHVKSEWLWKALQLENAPRIVVGLTATPFSAGLGTVYDDLLKPVSTQELIDLGFLSPFRIYAPSHPDLSKVKTVAGDYQESGLAEVMMQDHLVADVVSTWLARAAGQATIVYCVDRAHASKVHDQFEKEGVSVAYIDANTPREERDEIGRKLQAHEIDVVCNIGTCTTGVDWPNVSCIVLARPTKSETLFVQCVGRGLRSAPGKEIATILDHTDNHLRLGMVTEIDFDGLSKGKPNRSGTTQKNEKLPTPKECPSCSCLVAAGVAECPNCGAPMRQRSSVETVEGELVEFAGKKAKPKAGKGDSVAEQIAALGKQRVFSEFLGYCEEKGSAPGRAAHFYRDIFEVWPRGLRECSIRPSPLVKSWIRSRNIAWAKSRAHHSAPGAAL